MKHDATAITASRCLAVLEMLPQSPTVGTVCGLLRAERFLDLLEVPFPDVNEGSFASSYLAYNILRKYPFRGLDRKGVALAGLLASEERCRDTNARFASYRGLPLSTRIRIDWIRGKIGNLLGEFNWDHAERGFAWGPGATTRLRNSHGDVYHKFSGQPETTLDNLPLAEAAIKRIPLWYGYMSDHGYKLKVVAGGKVTTVPKSAKTDRIIEMQPCMNIYIQKGIGSLIRDRLRRVGVNLNDQSLNQRLASVGTVRNLGTVDLSNASDTVAKQVVWMFLPDDWYAALQQCRTSRYTLSSQVFTSEKFSSMGNGFTFELESLIFWAISQLAIHETRVKDRTCAIYGDDIVVASECIPVLFELLELFGFEPNMKKSFWTGPFRESCGKHFHSGYEVTPIYVDEEIISPSRSAWFSNSVRRWLHRAEATREVENSHAIWLSTLKHVDPAFCNVIPEGYGDGGIVAPEQRTDAYPSKLIFPCESAPLKKFLKRRSSPCYQSGSWFRHLAVSRVDLSARDPSDVPYLLRGLYQIGLGWDPAMRIAGWRAFDAKVMHASQKRIDSLLPLPSLGNSGVKREYRVHETSGWCSSWDSLDLSII